VRLNGQVVTEKKGVNIEKNFGKILPGTYKNKKIGCLSRRFPGVLSSNVFCFIHPIDFVKLDNTFGFERNQQNHIKSPHKDSENGIGHLKMNESCR
jgi:adenine specific DNA methylase Mod